MHPRLIFHAGRYARQYVAAFMTTLLLCSASALAIEKDQTGDAALPDVTLPVPVPVSAAMSGISAKSGFSASTAAPGDVFGTTLFQGSFTTGAATPFNPDHIIAIGDRIRLRLWGGFDYDAVLPVDLHGQVFLPHAGPLQLAGLPNQQLAAAVTGALRRVFRQQVSVYAGLEAAQPVRVYVAGFVHKPGMYDGTSSESVLRYLDKAGGIDPERGTFIQVQVKRGNQLRASINLYDFLLKGELPYVQLANGDVIFVGPRLHTARTTGLCANVNRFEFAGESVRLSEISAAARPAPEATHIRIMRNGARLQHVDYLAVADSSDTVLYPGDVITYAADKRAATITVRVSGEHEGEQEIVLPYGSRVGNLRTQLRLTERAVPADMQLFRESVRERQKTLLDMQLRHLEAAVLTAPSATEEEARLRRNEAALVLQWVARARTAQPTGQIVMGEGAVRDQLLLENGDLLHIPVNDGLVLVGGEVLFPNAMAAVPGRAVRDYIKQAGGYTQHANDARVVIVHRDGSATDADIFTVAATGDQIIVLPRVRFKTRQFARDMVQMMYQLAVSARVAFGIF